MANPVRFGWGRGNDPAALIKKMMARKARMAEMHKTAIGQAALVVESELAKRVWLAKKVNVQDTGTGKELSPSQKLPYDSRTQTTDSGAVARFKLTSFWSRVRLNGVLAAGLLRAFAAAGRSDELFRKGLWLRFKGAAKSAARHFVEFARHGRLQAWAQRPEKGQQFIKHAVRIKDLTAMDKLQMGGALKASESRIRAIWERATKEGFK